MGSIRKLCDGSYALVNSKDEIIYSGTLGECEKKKDKESDF